MRQEIVLEKKEADLIAVYEGYKDHQFKDDQKIEFK